MSNTRQVLTALGVTALLVVLGMAALLMTNSAHAESLPMELAAYKAGKVRVGKEYQVAVVACDARAASARQSCVDAAQTRKRIARAELKYDYTGSPADGARLRQAKAALAPGK
jgi:hypothetical protein